MSSGLSGIFGGERNTLYGDFVISSFDIPSGAEIGPNLKAAIVEVVQEYYRNTIIPGLMGSGGEGLYKKQEGEES